MIEKYRSTGTVSRHPANLDGPLGNPVFALVDGHINVLDSGLRQSVSYTVGRTVLWCYGAHEAGAATAGVTVDKLPQISPVDFKHGADICSDDTGHQP